MIRQARDGDENTMDFVTIALEAWTDAPVASRGATFPRGFPTLRASWGRSSVG